jgi:protein gp37
MGEKTAIEWCHHTFNPWWGCVEVSPACDHCYARELATRYGHPVWGKDASRRFFDDEHWNAPFRWARRAARDGVRRRVFCASMADVLERRDDAVDRQLEEARHRLWVVIANTPQLDWLLLTKRPQEYAKLVPPAILARPNVWPGTTVERADYSWRISTLLAIDGSGPRWLSVEPLLGPIDLRSWLPGFGWPTGSRWAVGWAIVGGESGSGPHERRLVQPFSDDGVHTRYVPKADGLAWVRTLRDQFVAADVPWFFKQWGGPTPKAGGRELDGRTWEEFPG